MQIHHLKQVSTIGQSNARYYINGKRVNLGKYRHIDAIAMRKDSFLTRVNGDKVTHSKTVYV